MSWSWPVPNSAYDLFVVLSMLNVDTVLIVLFYGLILHTVLSIASKAECLKALNTCVSHLCAMMLFCASLIGLSMIHRFGKQAFPLSPLLLYYLHYLTPPLLNLIIYTISLSKLRRSEWGCCVSSGGIEVTIEIRNVIKIFAGSKQRQGIFRHSCSLINNFVLGRLYRVPMKTKTSSSVSVNSLSHG